MKKKVQNENNKEQKDMMDTKTVIHDENGKQNKSENDLKDALSVKEKNDDKEEKTINDQYAGWLKMLHILSINNQKENNSVKEFNAYSGIVYEVQANDSLEVPVALAAFVSGACLLFVVTDVLAVRCTAQITWDPGGEPVLRRNMRKLDR